MKRFFPAVSLIALSLAPLPPQPRAVTEKNESMIVAFYDQERVKGSPELENFQFFLDPIRKIAQRDFPDAEFKVTRGGELIHLPDGTGLNIQNLQPALGYVLAERGRKRRVLSGVQSDKDFACAAAAFFRRHSPACSK